MKRIYLDYAATTPVHPAVMAAMQDYFTNKFGNASSLHTTGIEARSAVEAARETIARCLKAHPDEIIFTSGGSESDNFAVKGIAGALRKKGDHIITSKIEHHAVLESCLFLQDQGFSVTFLPVDKDGLVDPGDLKKTITPRTILVSIMHANNEIGTIEPISAISAVCREKGVYFHTDAVQSFGSINTAVDDLGVDLLSITAHKFYGPKGVGALYVRKGTRIVPLIHGGGQEWSKRASTHNVPGIVGMAKAAELAITETPERVEHVRTLRDRLIKSLFEQVEDLKLNGHPQQRLPNNINLIVKYVEGEALLVKLDTLGIEVSSGSACTSGSLDPSHVLSAIGVPPEEARGSIRITLGRWTTSDDIGYVIEQLPRVVKELRSISAYKKHP